jgi:thymidine kinase
MAKLYFRYGAVGSAKTLNLLAVAHNYKQQNKKTILIKPSLDDRFGKEQIKSRAGLEAKADILVDANTRLLDHDYSDTQCILVDEAQFLPANVIDDLRIISIKYQTPVLCYGLRTDFRSKLFEGAKRLMELADSIEEVKSTCFYCNRKGIMNLKYCDGVPTVDGPSVELGSEEKYHPACYPCYDKLLTESKAKLNPKEEHANA